MKFNTVYFSNFEISSTSLKLVPNLKVSKNTYSKALIRENMVWVLSRMFFLKFPKNFQNSYVKKQSNFHAVGTLKETNGLLKDLISALSLVIHNICKFKTFQLFLRCSIWTSDTKKTSKTVLPIFSTYDVGWHLLFQNWCKAI